MSPVTFLLPLFKKIIYLAEPGLSSHLWDLVP